MKNQTTNVNLHVNVKDIIKHCEHKNNHYKGCKDYVSYSAPNKIVNGSTITLIKDNSYTFTVAADHNAFIPHKLDKFSTHGLLNVTSNRHSTSIVDVTAIKEGLDSHVSMTAHFKDEQKNEYIITWDPTIKVKGGTNNDDA